jgi:phospholipase/carboxylesterase
LRVRAATEAPARLLLLVHGWTGDENSMWVFARNLPGGYWIVAPRAPYATSPSGYSWRPSRPGAHDRPSFEDLQPAVEPLLSFVDSYAAQHSMAALEFDAMGFSQGAALLSILALLRPERVRRLGLLAGFVPQGAEPLAESRPLQGKPLFVAHGTLDDLVPIDVARASVDVLATAGANVTYCEDDVGHKLSAKCMRALQTYFGAV